MREITALQITETVRELFLSANYDIGQDVYNCVLSATHTEPSPIGRAVLGQLVENYRIAHSQRVAICQDTGMAVLFIKLGQQVQVVGGSFHEAVTQGVRRAYAEGYLRKSVVDDPLYDRINTRDNTPAILHIEITDDDRIEFLATPKGFGSENMGGVKLLVPADGEAGVIDFVVDTVRRAGPNPCPPIVVGVGLGGTMEKAATLAKYATARPLESRNPHPRYAALEEKLLTAINKLGIGPGGTGGSTTALGVNVEYFPTHIAGMPVAVNLCCHAARHAHAVL